MEGLQAQSMPNSDFPDPFNIFNMFHRDRQQTTHRTKDTLHPIFVSLKELYNGTIKKMKVLDQNLVSSFPVPIVMELEREH